MLLELGHVGLTANPILIKDICHLMQPFLLEQRTPTFVFCVPKVKKLIGQTDSVGKAV